MEEKAGAKAMRCKHIGGVPETIGCKCRWFVFMKQEEGGKEDSQRSGPRGSTAFWAREETEAFILNETGKEWRVLNRELM